jgi:hypothetical protein
VKRESKREEIERESGSRNSEEKAIHVLYRLLLVCWKDLANTYSQALGSERNRFHKLEEEHYRKVERNQRKERDSERYRFF